MEKVISCPVEYLHFGGGKAEGRRQKRCGPASASDASSRNPARFPRHGNADQEREEKVRREKVF